MDLILIFIVISIIANIAGAVKKSGQKQKQGQSGKVMPKSAASRRRDLFKDFRDLLENKPFVDTARQPVADKPKGPIRESKDSIRTRMVRSPDRVSHLGDKKEKEKELKLESEKMPTISLTDVQRAIVMAEVLGKPKALRK